MWLISWWLFPTISAAMWLAMLLSMLIVWATSANRTLPSMLPGEIAYISDIGAFSLKPLFITGSVITVVCLDLGFIAERWLRHTGRLARNTSNTQKFLNTCSTIFAIAGAAGLILLSNFDTYRHPRLHDIFLLIFIGGYIISAIFLCAEYQRLGIHYRNHRILAISFWVKLMFIIVEFIFAVIFVATSRTGHKNVAAVFEWIIAFVFTFWVLSFIIDLLPSVRTKHHIPQGEKDVMMAERGMNTGGVVGGRDTRFSQQSTRQGSIEQNLTNDSAGPNRAGGKMIAGDAHTPPQKKGLRRFF